MTCSTVEPWLVDHARGVALETDRAAQVEQHLRECRQCAARLDSERAMSAALQRLARDTAAWAPAASSEAALLAAFDAARGRRAGAPGWIMYPAAAAVLAVVAATFTWTQEHRRSSVAASAPSPRTIASRPRLAGVPDIHVARSTEPHRVSRRRSSHSFRATTAFISWPGAAELPAFESGHLMRVDLPASVARSLGLVPPAETAVVQADVLVGQDGFARAVRLAP